VGLDEFRADVGQSGVPSLPFHPDTLVNRARINGKAAVDLSWIRSESRHGLGWEALTVQLTEAVPVWDLEGGAGTPPTTPVPSDDPDEDIETL
jgi:hypothetical protein